MKGPLRGAQPQQTVEAKKTRLLRDTRIDVTANGGHTRREQNDGRLTITMRQQKMAESEPHLAACTTVIAHSETQCKEHEQAGEDGRQRHPQSTCTRRRYDEGAATIPDTTQPSAGTGAGPSAAVPLSYLDCELPSNMSGRTLTAEGAGECMHSNEQHQSKSRVHSSAGQSQANPKS